MTPPAWIGTAGAAVCACLLALLGPAAAQAANGDISTVAGNGTYASSGDGGAATSASLQSPVGIAVAPNGDVYVADYGADRVRKITAAGTITTVAGNGTAGFSGDGGPATSAQLNAPGDVAIDGAGNLYISDGGNHRIRKVALDGTISTFAGIGSSGLSGDGGQATLAQLGTPWGLDFDSSGYLYFADYNHSVRKISPLGIITRVAGTGVAGSAGDGGQATSATLNQPVDVAFDSLGNLYVSEQAGDRIRKITPGGIISTVAGNGTAGSTGDGGAASAATLNQPGGLAVDANDDLYVSEYAAAVIRKISGGTITRVAGNRTPGYLGDGGAATSAEVSLPSGIGVNAAGNLFLADLGNYRVRKVVGVAPPDAPTLGSTTPASPANNNSPKVVGTAAPGSTVSLYTDSGCTSTVAASGSASTFGSTGLTVAVTDDSTTTLYAKAAVNGLTSACSSSSVTYVEDSTAPAQPSVTGPATPGSGRSPSWSWTGEAGATFQCQLDRAGTIISAYAPCTSAKSYSLSGQPDGTYTFSVRATDAAGNTGTARTSNYVLDTTAPAAPSITSSPGSISNNPSPAWSFTGEALATLECRVERSGAAVYDWATCTSGQTFDLSAQVDGAYTLLVRARDAAGNVSATTTSATYALDRAAPPGPSITSTPGVAGHATNPGWSFSGEAGATFECRLDRGGTQVADWVGCTTSKSYDISGLQDGVYTFSVRQTDAAGNTGSAGTSDYTFDTVAPDPPTVTGAPASPSNGTAPSWSFTTELGATTECRLDRGATNISAWAPCSATRSYSLSAQPDGTYTFSVRATDAAGNTGAAQTSQYTLDRVAPGTPSVTPPATPGNDSAPGWSFSSEAGATFECKFASGGTTLSDWAACTSSKSYSLSGRPDGTYTFSVRATDSAGNTGTSRASDYVYDTTPPAPASIGSGPTSPGNDPVPQWSFSGGVGGNGFECKLDRGATSVSGWGACTSPASFDLSSQPDGTYTFSVRARDAAGNRSAAVTSDFTLDTSVPVTPTLTSTPGPTGSNRSISWGFSGDGTETFECRLVNGSTTVSDWAACTSPHAYSLSGEPDGTYTFAVRGVAAGGTRGAAAGDGYVLDTNAPAAPAIVTPPPATGSASNPTWSFTAEAGAQVQCRIDRDGTQVVAWTNCSSPYTADLSGQPDGTYTLRLVATDAAGNTGSEQTSAYVFDTTAPAAPSVSLPASTTANNAQPSFPFVTQGGYTYECRLGGVSGTDANWQSCTSPRLYDLSSRPDGVYTFQVRATDTAGNVGAPGSATYELDRSPASVQLGAAPGAVSNERWPSWGFSAEAGATFECSLGAGGNTLFDWSLCTSPQMYDLSTRSDGTYLFSVRARDRAGNLGSPVSSGYTLDTSAPAKPAIKSTPATPNRDRSPTWTFTAEAGATIECRLELKRSPVYDWAACTSPKTYTLRDANDGIYRLLVRARDTAGNTGATAGDDYELDSTDPTPPTIDAAPQNNRTDLSPTWKFSGEDDAAFECALDRGSDNVQKRAPCASPMTYKIGGLPAGTYTFSVWATDPAGNTSKVRQDQFVVAASATDPSTPSGSSNNNTGSNSPGAPTSPTPDSSTPAGSPNAPSDKRTAGTDGNKPGSRVTAGKPGTQPGQPGPTGSRPGASGGSSGSGGSSNDGSGTPHKKRHGAAAAAHAVAAALGKAATVVTKNADKSVFPFSLVLIVFLFLGIQNRIDRSDPKLALAPLTADPDLEFSPPPTTQ